MIFATLASLAGLLVGALLLYWVCRKVDDSAPKDPAEWRK